VSLLFIANLNKKASAEAGLFVQVQLSVGAMALVTIVTVIDAGEYLIVDFDVFIAAG
tara:strand:- start:6 stop:176 length:171 start_codon:yes stop_codon:yes gene_type:complete